MKPQNKKIWPIINIKTTIQLLDMKQEIKEKTWWNIADKVAQKLENEYETNRT